VCCPTGDESGETPVGERSLTRDRGGGTRGLLLTAVTGGEASLGWWLPWLQTTVARTWKVVLASTDLALQSPTCGADPSPWMGSEGSQSELLRTGERTRQRPLAECLVRLTQRMKNEGGKCGVMLVFYGVMKATKAADGTIDSWTFGCFTKSQSGCNFSFVQPSDVTDMLTWRRLQAFQSFLPLAGRCPSGPCWRIVPSQPSFGAMIRNGKHTWDCLTVGSTTGELFRAYMRPPMPVG